MVPPVPRKTSLLNHIDDRIVDESENRIRATIAVPFTKITTDKLTHAARDELVKRLVARGFERTPKMLRVPLSAQIETLVAAGARVPRKDLAKRVKGASKTEIDANLAKLLRERRVHLVVRTQTEVLVSGGERVIGLTEMNQLAKAITTLAKTVKKVQAKGLPRTILREDLDAVLGSSVQMPKFATPNSNDGAERLVVETLRQMEDPSLKLVRIPDLVRALASRFSTEAVHLALTKVAETGSIELRPDAGTEFLKSEDIPLCLPGPRGTVFSYARRVSS